jgi:hypothetical protein
MARCSNCDVEVSDEATTCPECGATFVEESTADGRSASIHERFRVRSIAIAAGGLSVTALLIQLVIPAIIGFEPVTPPWQPILFFVFWGAAIAGVWIQTKRGYTVAAGVFALAAVWSGVAALGGPALRLGPLGRLMATDPATLLVSTIYTLQGVTQSRGQLEHGLVGLATIVGTLFSGVIAVVLWRTRQQIATSGTRTAETSTATRTRSSGIRQYAPLLFLSGSVLFVILIPLAGVIGGSEQMGARAIAAAFPSLLTAVVVLVEVTQPSMADPAINTPLAVVLGSIIPVSLTIDLLVMRRDTDWNPNRLLYPLGAVLVWFVTLPIYLYRRYKTMATE